jgi:anti-sigma factor RsiW
MGSYASGLGGELGCPVIDEDLHAYVDRQLPAERRPVVERFLQDNTESARRVSAYAAQREALRAALAGPTREPIPERLNPYLMLQKRTSEKRRSEHQIVWRMAATVVLAIGLGGAGGWGAHVGYGRLEQRQVDTFGQQAAAAYLTLAQATPQPLQVASIDGLSTSVSKALGVPVQFHDTASAGFTLLSGWVLPAPNGQAVQLAFRDVKDNKVITMYLEGRPGAKETPFRRVAGAGVPTVAWEDDDLACAISGTVDPERLEQVGRSIYDALLS